MEDVIRQRIKYLVEHGELYPTKEESSVQHRRIWMAISVLALLQFAVLIVDLMH